MKDYRGDDMKARLILAVVIMVIAAIIYFGNKLLNLVI
jgi:hypothetical protein